MRWIKERAEALLQLRCIEINGDWDAFIEFVHDQLQQQATKTRKNPTHALSKTKAITRRWSQLRLLYFSREMAVTAPNLFRLKIVLCTNI